MVSSLLSHLKLVSLIQSDPVQVVVEASFSLLLQTHTHTHTQAGPPSVSLIEQQRIPEAAAAPLICVGVSDSADTMPNTRLGKRSPFGALVGPETTRPGVVVAMGPQGISRVRGHSDLKEFFQCGGAGDPQAASASCGRSVSTCIDVPRSRTAPQEVDMDELMAAMVLSSLSCSPPPQGSAHKDTAGPLTDGGAVELSDSGSSGYWSVDPRSPAPSSPTDEARGGSATPPDEGLDMELDQVLFEEPTPRKRRNSLKAAFRCLWPACGKVLTSVVGIKRHIRTVHLCHGGEHERCSRSEEDFYYCVINQWEEPHCQSPPSAPPRGHAPCTSPPSAPPLPPPSLPIGTALSCSAPSPCSSFWQVQSEHSYQAPPPSPVVSHAASCGFMAVPTTCSRQGATFRVRSVSVGEQWLQQHSAPCRRIRSEAKKCRKVYGIEHRELWCTACRWKKACQRFLD
ncbi:zinc finger protein 395-like isoform X2 [Gambusia affinis]|uniref:zinc finger protein 395-like isoform X2 n=1 Tax=Gambusia affinis TaxID=33528 RepID=UPI001CDCA52F|nr:zinc finger protein 395-like isoform X2 [Gambusia affinis]